MTTEQFIEHIDLILSLPDGSPRQKSQLERLHGRLHMAARLDTTLGRQAHGHRHTLFLGENLRKRLEVVKARLLSKGDA